MRNEPGLVWRLVLALLPSFFYDALGPASLQGQESPRELSCAEFPDDLTAEDLQERYGVENIRIDSLYGMDDGPVRGLVVFPESADHRLDIFWEDPERMIALREVRTRGRGWTTPSGLSAGMRLREVEELNGWPFRLAGFSTEVQGAVRSWGEGRIQDRLSWEPSTASCAYVIHFQPPYDGSADFDLVRQVRSGREYSSGHLALQELNPEVVTLRT